MARGVALTLLVATSLSACVTSRVEDARETKTGIRDGESVVIMAKSYHLGNETEDKYVDCIQHALARGSDKLNVIPSDEFIDSLFPWFEPRTAPAETKNLAKLMERPGVADKIAQELTSGKYDVVLASYNDRTIVASQLAAAPGTTTYVPVTTEGEQKAEAAHSYERYLSDDDDFTQFLRVIHRTLKASRA